MVKTLVIGFGNPILCDDGVGNHVARTLAGRIKRSDTTIIETSSAGLDIVDLISGYDKVIIIDAIMTGKSKPGIIHRVSPSELNSTLHSVSLHDLSLGNAIELGKKLGVTMPGQIIIFGIEVQNIDTFSETCTVEVESAIPGCIDLILKELY
jgi:hydrogenase maturation protease